jgi:hypothetical protein
MDSPYTGMWSLIYETIRAFWSITEPLIEGAAREKKVPGELYYYGELGLEIFSLENFRKRDPFSNPANFTQAFETLAGGGWIVPAGEGEYRVTEEAREAARDLVRTGDAALGAREIISVGDAERLKALLQRLVLANFRAAEPPVKWATRVRFRVADEASPLLAQIREALMDLFAYRDDSHMAAWRDYPVSGIAWSAFGMIWSHAAFSPEAMAEQAWFRGFAAEDYARALVELRGRGWIDGEGQLTPVGRKLRDAAEHLTDAYFYAPWVALSDDEIQELRVRLLELRNQLD